jgi:hypothetical protein
LFSWNKKTSEEPQAPQESAIPFEILLPEALMTKEIPDWRIASKLLALLAESQMPSQHLEVFEGMPVVNAPYPLIKQFITTVNGARQLKSFVDQANSMLFQANQVDAIGSLCCLVQGGVHRVKQTFHPYFLTEAKVRSHIKGDLPKRSHPAVPL